MLRSLQKKDAPYMLEWMHDPSVVKYMKTDFGAKTLEDCYSFIDASHDPSENLHLAVTDDNDEYMGTVSLKNIKDGSAEFGITVRKCAMGKGYSQFGMKSIIEIGKNQCGISKIYWCVDPENKRALNFYDRLGFLRCVMPVEACGYSEEEKKNFIWYIIDDMQ